MGWKQWIYMWVSGDSDIYDFESAGVGTDKYDVTLKKNLSATYQPITSLSTEARLKRNVQDNHCQKQLVHARKHSVFTGENPVRRVYGTIRTPNQIIHKRIFSKSPSMRRAL